MTTRRLFIKQALAGTAGLLVMPTSQITLSQPADIKISLAEWSLHRTLKAGELVNSDFPDKARRDFDIDTVEYVCQFFGDRKMDWREAASDEKNLSYLLQRSKDAGVNNHLIMVDEEGFLALPNDSERLQAVDNHKKWVEAAAFLGCSSVRVNLHGIGDTEDKRVASIDSLSRLGEYAAPMNVNILVENHGSDSSKGFWMASVVKDVNMPNVGTLPDFGNFCVSEEWGTTQGGCEDEYDRYKGVEEMLPYAKAVSAKTYDFGPDGEQPLMDYKRLLDIVKKSGFKGYIGIEYEGFTQPEEEGIRKSKALIEKYL